MSESSFDRLPPQNVEAEQAVLGAILIAPEILPALLENIHPDDFYRNSHQLIFSCAMEIAEKGEPVDLITLMATLQSQGKLEEAGGVEYIAGLANTVPTAANAEYHAGIVADRAMLRRIIGVSTEIAASGYAGTDDVGELLDTAERRILALVQSRSDKGFTPIRDVLMQAYERIEYLFHHRDGLLYCPHRMPPMGQMDGEYLVSC